jgi:hypothetical protein
MGLLEDTPDLRWFDKYGSCRMCGKKSEGLLRGSQNQSYGDHCQRCADKRLKASERVRGQLNRENQ